MDNKNVTQFLHFFPSLSGVLFDLPSCPINTEFKVLQKVLNTSSQTHNSTLCVTSQKMSHLNYFWPATTLCTHSYTHCAPHPPTHTHFPPPATHTLSLSHTHHTQRTQGAFLPPVDFVVSVSVFTFLLQGASSQPGYHLARR